MDRSRGDHDDPPAKWQQWNRDQDHIHTSKYYHLQHPIDQPKADIALSSSRPVPPRVLSLRQMESQEWHPRALVVDLLQAVALSPH